jgi:hypothetical protein
MSNMPAECVYETLYPTRKVVPRVHHIEIAYIKELLLGPSESFAVILMLGVISILLQTQSLWVLL